MSESKLRPRKELEEALERINQSFNFKDAHLELSSNARSEDVVKFMKEHFHLDETLCKSIGQTVDDELSNILMKNLSENLSVLLISNTTDEIIACRTMAIAKRNEVADRSKTENIKWVKIMDFLRHRYHEMDVFKRFNVDTAVAFIALATHRDHRAQGIASKLMQATLLFCKELGLSPVCIKGEGTSNYSQRIFEKFDFEAIHTMKYDEYKIDGEIVFKNTGDNESTKCYVKQL